MKTREPDPAARAWQLLGHASTVRPGEDFARRAAADAARTPQQAPANIIRWVRIAAPLAAAAAVAIAFAWPSLSPAPAASQDSLDRLARIEAALSSLPEDPDLEGIHPSAVLLATLEDPSQLTDEQFVALLY
jgi:hypothetical protein